MRDLLRALGADVERLSADETAQLQIRWREEFAGDITDVPLATSSGGYDWHVFSYERVFAVVGDEAVREYASCSAREFWVLPHGRNGGLAVRSDVLPDLRRRRRDAYVVPKDFEWTMVYTHEAEFGPYFTTRAWVQTKVPSARANPAQQPPRPEARG